MIEQPLTAERLRALMDYDPVTGVLTARVDQMKRRIGDSVGYAHRKGYLAACVDWRAYLVHRLVWLHVHGEWPKGVIDHLNFDKRDNRIANLRDTSPTGNQQNRPGPNRNSKSGILGVRQMASGRWKAEITSKGRVIDLGLFDTPEEAQTVRSAARAKYHLEAPQ
jgi:hypothetical protein